MRSPALHARLALRRNAPCALRPEHLPGVSRPEIRERLHFPPTAGLRVLLATGVNPCPQHERPCPALDTQNLPRFMLPTRKFCMAYFRF